MTNITQNLRREHQVVLAKLAEFEAALERHDVAAIRDGVRFLEEKLVPHRRKEEEALFPALGKHIGTEVGPVACMLEEHREEGDKLQELREALAQSSGAEGRARVAVAGQQILSHLRAHIQKEDNVLFPMVEGMLSEPEKREAQARMASIGSCCGECGEAPHAVAPPREAEAPEAYRDFLSRHPLLENAWQFAREAETDGPLDERTMRLVKLGVALGAGREDAVRPAVREARAAGITDDELCQIVAAVAGTIGLPSATAADAWIRESAEPVAP